MDALRALFRWYLVEVGTALFALLTFLEPGLERLLWAGLLLMGLIVLTFKHGGNERGVRLLRAILGLAALALALFGVGLTGAGVFLMVQGSFGLLAGMVLVPAGIGILGAGWTAFHMARTKLGRWSETGFARIEREGFSSLRAPIDRPTHARTEAEPR